MSDHLVSLIRTYVPAAVGALIAWLATLGINLDADTTAALVAGTTGLATAVYYTLARVAETRWPRCRHTPRHGTAPVLRSPVQQPSRCLVESSH